MQAAANIVIGVVALLHVWVLVLEMFLWTKPAGRRAFGSSPEFALTTRRMAANQGLYNGFLAAGLAWGLVAGNLQVKVFFLVCVMLAGLYGGWSVNRRIFFIQAVPALIALVLLSLPG